MDTKVRQHHGRNIKRLRDILGVKQEAIAIGLNITQQRVSELEQKDTIDDDTLEKVSKILNVPVDRIKEFNEERLTQYVSGNTFENNESSPIGFGIGVGQNDFDKNNVYNPIEKITELYERMLKEKDETINKLEKELSNFKKSTH